MDEFNKKFIDANPELDFVRFISAKIDADNDKVILSAVYDRSRGEEYAQSEKKVRAAAAGLFPPFANVSVVASPSVAGSRELLHTARDFLLKESAIVASAADGDNISVLMGEPPSVTLVLTPAVAEYADHENVCPRLKEYIDTRMFSDVRVRVTVRDEDPAEITRTLNEKIYKPRFAYERPDEGRAIDPVGRTPMCGKLVEGEAKYICDCVEPEYVVIYGALLDLREREYTPRKPKEGETTRKFASFVLDDGTGKIRCVWFPTADNKNAISYLENGRYYVMSGKTEYDERANDGSLQFSVRRFSGCERAEFEINKVVRLPDPDYRYVRPKEYVALSQSSLYDSAEPRTDEPLVIFALMTVSDNKYRPGELIEMAAVRIEHGTIVETMDSLICPHGNMTDDERASAGLVASDLKGKPYFEQILPDFYKFFTGRTVTAFPLDANVSMLKGYMDKLHIPMPETADMTLFASSQELRRVRPKNTRRAYPTALAYAKFLTNMH